MVVLGLRKCRQCKIGYAALEGLTEFKGCVL